MSCEHPALVQARGEALEAAGEYLEAAALYKANCEAQVAAPDRCLVPGTYAPGSAAAAVQLARHWGYAGLAYKRAAEAEYLRCRGRGAAVPPARWSRSLTAAFNNATACYRSGAATLEPWQPGRRGGVATAGCSSAEREVERERLDLACKAVFLNSAMDRETTPAGMAAMLDVFRPTYSASNRLMPRFGAVGSSVYIYVLDLAQPPGAMLALTSAGQHKTDGWTVVRLPLDAPVPELYGGSPLTGKRVALGRSASFVQLRRVLAAAQPVVRVSTAPTPSAAAGEPAPDEGSGDGIDHAVGQPARETFEQGAFKGPTPLTPLPQRRCALPSCGSTEPGLNVCHGCAAVLYCGSACSRTHWPHHKAACRAAAAAAAKKRKADGDEE